MSKEVERMLGPRHPLPIYRRGQSVRVYMGAGWAKGTVDQSDRNGCTVYLSQLRRTTRCHDARNIQPL